MGMCEAAASSKNTDLFAQSRRLAARCGKKKAMLAVGLRVLVIIYHVLSGKKSCEELGGNYFDERERQAAEKRLVRRFEEPGYQVSLQKPFPCSQHLWETTWG
jgi:transposase